MQELEEENTLIKNQECELNPFQSVVITEIADWKYRDGGSAGIEILSIPFIPPSHLIFSGLEFYSAKVHLRTREYLLSQNP